MGEDTPTPAETRGGREDRYTLEGAVLSFTLLEEKRSRWKDCVRRVTRRRVAFLPLFYKWRLWKKEIIQLEVEVIVKLVLCHQHL